MVEDDRLSSNKNFVHRYIDIQSGYAYVICKGHRRAKKDGLVRQHIVIFEQTYDCCLLNWGVVHHRDGNKSNNIWYNLQGMIIRKHTALHHKGKNVSKETRMRMSKKISASKLGKNNIRIKDRIILNKWGLKDKVIYP